MPVIAALELDHPRTTGDAPRHPQRGHRRLGAGVHHPDHLDRRHECRQPLRHAHFERGGCAEGGALVRLPRDGGHDVRMRMPEDHRSPRPDEVDELVPVHVPDARAGSARDEARRPAHRTERAHGRVDTAGHQLAGAVEQRGARGGRVSLEF